jgi:hypothetical protein
VIAATSQTLGAPRRGFAGRFEIIGSRAGASCEKHPHSLERVSKSHPGLVWQSASGRAAYLVSMAERGLLGGAGENDNVSQVFHPDGRSWPSNSQYAFKLM